MIHAVFQRFGRLRDPQPTWFTPCFNASKRSQSREIRDSHHVSTPRRAENLAKYVIHAVSQCFGWLRTSQKMWFTQGCNAAICSKPRKILDSCCVTMFRSAQNLRQTMSYLWCLQRIELVIIIIASYTLKLVTLGSSFHCFRKGMNVWKGMQENYWEIWEHFRRLSWDKPVQGS